MCGRYGRWSRRQRVEELLGIEPTGLDDFPDHYNITPGVNTWIVRAKGGKPALYSYLWGLVPYWSKDPKKGVRPVNAKAGTAHEKPMFRKLIRERRCLIPANCYYEWKQTPIGKQRLSVIAVRAGDLVRALEGHSLAQTPKLLLVALVERLEAPATGRKGG